MPRYEILDDAGTVVNTIMADQAFVDATHPGRFRLAEDPPAPEVQPPADLSETDETWI